jgi:hypothetical protein
VEPLSAPTIESSALLRRAHVHLWVVYSSMKTHI